MAMRCPTCGTENAAGRAQCVRCGTRLRPTAARGPVARSAAGSAEAEAVLMAGLRRDLRRLAVVAVVVVAVAAVLGALLR
ncbi:MAG: hypothetical protein QN174_03780 [Armatimonadota bacterium]|nr:hypothetical protein [Armatimonadota bacterium]